MAHNVNVSANYNCSDKRIKGDDGDEGPDEDDTIKEDDTEVAYLFEQYSEDSAEANWPRTESSSNEISLPQHVTHKHVHNLSDVFDQELIKQLTVSMVKLNYIWTRIGTEPNEADDKIGHVQNKMTEMMQELVDKEDSRYRAYGKRIRHLKDQLESVLADMAVFANEEQLRLWMRSSEQTEGDRTSESKQLDSCLRSQIGFLRKRYQSLVKHRDKHLQEFNSLKDALECTLNLLGLPESNDFQCEEIRVKRVATSDEMTLLKEVVDKYRTILEQRKVYCQEVSFKIRAIVNLVPLKIDEDCCLFGDDGKLDNKFVFSEANQAKLDQLHNQVLESANDVWQQLLNSYELLSKLYRLFEVNIELRHPFFNEIAQMNCSIDDLKQRSLPWQHAFREQKVTLVDALDELQLENEHYQSLKNERMAELIDSIRNQIAILLVECLVQMDSLRPDQRFRFLFVDKFDEDMLSVHEKELDRLHQYHAKHEQILTLVVKWREQKNSLFECDQLLQNGNNYRNRGGILQQILAKQRILKKRLNQSAQQIDLWLQQNYSSSQLKNDDSLPFDLYNVRMEDIANEVDLPSHQKLHKADKRIVNRKSTMSMTMSTPFTPPGKRIAFSKQKLFESTKIKNSRPGVSGQFISRTTGNANFNGNR